MTCKSSHRVLGAPGPYVDFFSRSASESRMGPARTGEFISRTAFHNASCRREPARETIGSRFLPVRRNGCQASLISLALETEPPVAVLGRDRHTSSIGRPTPLTRAAPLESALAASRCGSGSPPIDLSSLGGGRRHQPHFPPLARRIEKRPITHAGSPSPSCAKVCAHVSCFAGRVPETDYFKAMIVLFPARNVRISPHRESSFLPASK